MLDNATLQVEVQHHRQRQQPAALPMTEIQDHGQRSPPQSSAAEGETRTALSDSCNTIYQQYITRILRFEVEIFHQLTAMQQHTNAPQYKTNISYTVTFQPTADWQYWYDGLNSLMKEMFLLTRKLVDIKHVCVLL